MPTMRPMTHEERRILYDNAVEVAKTFFARQHEYYAPSARETNIMAHAILLLAEERTGSIPAIQLSAVPSDDPIDGPVGQDRPKANARQVGGEHYGLSSFQHWDMVNLFKLDYFQGQITKYVMRWRQKNGIPDLQKAAHFLEKYIELESKSKPEPSNG